ncbi:hypothetical protein CVT26_014802 [Gymnopilus dilepis]|uniref:BZIP domain-containing protein n=1 Tax=Gymnopilus dilepis TaxID=231916 RepID=A0A409W3V7_9AGAR|nr:hypothetical protein CVT26_014802 [Gymnopilus dilepis]
MSSISPWSELTLHTPCAASCECRCHSDHWEKYLTDLIQELEAARQYFRERQHGSEGHWHEEGKGEGSNVEQGKQSKKVRRKEIDARYRAVNRERLRQKAAQYRTAKKRKQEDEATYQRLVTSDFAADDILGSTGPPIFPLSAPGSMSLNDILASVGPGIAQTQSL